MDLFNNKNNNNHRFIGFSYEAFIKSPNWVGLGRVAVTSTEFTAVVTL